MERTILVVEDSPTQGERVRLLLEDHGYQVEVARDGHEGLERARRRPPPDLIISDVMMPRMDGYELCRAIKSAEKTMQIPFVLLTDRRNAIDIITGLERGADNFITKPFEDDYLLERIRRIFEQLEFRRDGHLEMEVALRVGARRIVLSTDKQQIFELLFSTFEEMCLLNGKLTESQRELSAANGQLQREIVERQRAEADADRANRAKSEFLSRMSHELRTPLNGILGFAQLLEREELNPEQGESVGHIVKGGRHLLTLINEVLDIAHIESGRLSISTEPVSTREAFGSALDLVRPQASAAAVALPAGLNADRYVLADRQRLQQVLLNLLSNAVKYTGQSGRVTISCTEPEPGRVRLGVSDTGPGIAPAMLERLYTPFDRLGADHSGIEGTGLGLALSKRLAEAMNGRLLVESRVGEGTTFTVELPAAEAPPERIADPQDAGAETDASRVRGTVLYIEDNLANLRLVERIVRHRPGITLLPAMQGSRGLELARGHRPDLIVLDLHLPDLPGTEVLTRLRHDPTTRHIPVVILSADATGAQIRALLAQGAHAYLTKPIEVAALLGVFDRLLNGTGG